MQSVGVAFSYLRAELACPPPKPEPSPVPGEDSYASACGGDRTGADRRWLAWLDSPQRAHPRDAVAAIRRAGGQVWYEWEYQDGRFYMGEFHCPWPKWLVDHVGVDYLGNVIRVDLTKRGSDADLAHVGNLCRLEDLLLIDSSVTDSGLAHLRRSTTLRSLFLAGTRISDSGLAHLKGLTRLEVLSLMDSAVTDAGLAHLNGLTLLSKSIRATHNSLTLE